MDRKWYRVTTRPRKKNHPPPSGTLLILLHGYGIDGTFIAMMMMMMMMMLLLRSYVEFLEGKTPMKRHVFSQL